MGCYIPDTEGDITKGGSHSKGDFIFNFNELLAEGGRVAEQISIDEIRLTSKPGWARFAAPFLRSQFNMAPDKAEELARCLADILFDKKVEIAKAEVVMLMLLLSGLRRSTRGQAEGKAGRGARSKTTLVFVRSSVIGTKRMLISFVAPTSLMT